MNLTEKFLQAMDIVMDQKLAESDRDITVTAKVVAKEPTGRYSVEYNSTIYSGVIASATYSIDDVVLMLVPQGNFDNSKSIIAKVGQEAAMVAVEDQYDLIGGNVIVFSGPQGVGTLWDVSSSDNKITLLESNRIDKEEYLLDNYVELYHKLRVSAKFTVTATSSKDTDTDSVNDINYGLRFTFANRTAGEPDYTYEMTIDDMAGDPYNLNGAGQSKIFIIPSTDKVGTIKKIEAFAENCEENTFAIDDLTIYGAFDPSKEGKSVWIQTLDGIELEKNGSLNLTSVVRHNGETVTDLRGFKFEWYAKDKTFPYGQDTWRKLGELTISDTEPAVYSVKYADIFHKEQTILCKVTEPNNDTYSNEVQIVASERPAETEWVTITKAVQPNKTTTISASVAANQLPEGATIKYDWSATTLAGLPYPINGTSSSSINLDTVLIGETLIVNCKVAYALSDSQDIWLGEKSDTVSQTIVSLEGIYTYYTAQPASATIDNLPGWHSGVFNPSDDDDIKTTEPGAQDILSDYWWSEAEYTGFSEQLPRLWAFEKVVYIGRETQINAPAMIAVWSASPYQMDLTNDGAVIVTNSTGNSKNPNLWDDANTTTRIILMQGDEPVSDTAEWTLTASSDTLNGNWVKDDEGNDTWEYNVTGFKNDALDQGFIIFTLTNGNIVLEKNFNVTKQKIGSDGAPATSYWIEASPSAIYKDAAGNYLTGFDSITFTGKLQRGDESPRNIQLGDDVRLEMWFDDSGTNEDNWGDEGEKITINLNNLDPSASPTKSITCRMFYYDGATDDFTLDTETVLISSEAKGIEDSYKIYKIHSDKDTAPNLPERANNGGKITDFKGWTETKDDPIPEVNTNNHWLWACDYTIFTDGTAYLSAPERITPQDAGQLTKELKALYCGHPIVRDTSNTVVPLDLDKLPWPAPITGQKKDGNDILITKEDQPGSNTSESGQCAISTSNLITQLIKNSQLSDWRDLPEWDDDEAYSIFSINSDGSISMCEDRNSPYGNDVASRIFMTPIEPQLSSQFTIEVTIGIKQPEGQQSGWTLNILEEPDPYTAPIASISGDQSGTYQTSFQLTKNPVYLQLKVHDAMPSSDEPADEVMITFSNFKILTAETLSYFYKNYSYFSQATIDNLSYTWYWYEQNTFNSIFANTPNIISQRYIYTTSQLVLNDVITDEGWSAPSLYSVNGKDPGDWNLYFQAMEENGGKEGVFEVEDVNGEKHVVMNASLIKTGTLAVTKNGKNILSAQLNGDNPEVEIAGWQVTENSIVDNKTAPLIGLSSSSNQSMFFAGQENASTMKTGQSYHDEVNLTYSSSPISGTINYPQKTPEGFENVFNSIFLAAQETYINTMQFGSTISYTHEDKISYNPAGFQQYTTWSLSMQPIANNGYRFIYTGSFSPVRGYYLGKFIYNHGSSTCYMIFYWTGVNFIKCDMTDNGVDDKPSKTCIIGERFYWTVSGNRIKDFNYDIYNCSQNADQYMLTDFGFQQLNIFTPNDAYPICTQSSYGNQWYIDSGKSWTSSARHLHLQFSKREKEITQQQNITHWHSDLQTFSYTLNDHLQARIYNNSTNAPSIDTPSEYQQIGWYEDNADELVLIGSAQRNVTISGATTQSGTVLTDTYKSTWYPNGGVIVEVERWFPFTQKIKVSLPYYHSNLTRTAQIEWPLLQLSTSNNEAYHYSINLNEEQQQYNITYYGSFLGNQLVLKLVRVWFDTTKRVYPFQVDASGIMYASNAHIEGNLNISNLKIINEGLGQNINIPIFQLPISNDKIFIVYAVLNDPINPTSISWKIEAQGQS